MKLNFKYFLIFLFILSIFFIQGGIVEAETIRVKGSTYKTGNYNQDLEKAINNALTRAVEKVVGTYVDSETKMENYNKINTSIFKKSRGYVKDYKVLNKKVGVEFYNVILEAEVEEGQVYNDLDALEFNLKRNNNPRIAFLIKQYTPHNIEISNEIVENHLSSQFKKRGFKIIDRKTLEKSLNNEKVNALINGDFKLAQQYKNQIPADIIITGKTGVNDINKLGNIGSNNFNVSMYSSTVDMTLKAINVSTGEVLAVDSYYHNEAGGSPEGATIKSFKRLSGKVARDFIKNISQEVVNDYKSINLFIENVFPNQLNSYKERLKEISEIKKVYLREFNNGLLSIELLVKNNTKTMTLQNKISNKVNVTLIHMTNSKLIFKRR